MPEKDRLTLDEWIQRLSRNYTNWDYPTFCKELGFKVEYDQKYWSLFRTLCDNIAQWDNDKLGKLFGERG